MPRSYTSIDHSALSSDTLAEASDTTQALFWRLLCISDDWGRFPLNPGKIRRLAQDFNHTEDQIAEAIKHFADSGSLTVYNADGMDVCIWNRWDDFQTMTWKNEAQFPNPEGKYELSTNPLSKKLREKRGRSGNIESCHIESCHIVSDVVTSDATPVTTPVKPKAKQKSEEKPRTPTAVSRWVDLVLELWDEKFIVIPSAAKHITDAYKALGSDLPEFEKRVCIFLNDPWVREHRPGPDHFLRNLNKYAREPLPKDFGYGT